MLTLPVVTNKAIFISIVLDENINGVKKSIKD